MFPQDVRDADAEERRQAGVLIGLGALMAVTGFVYMPVFVVLGLPDFVLLSGQMAAALAGLLWLYHRTGARRMVAHGVLATIFLVMFVAPLSGSIEQGLVLPWLLIVPVYAVLLVGARAALPWAALVCLAYVLLCGIGGSAWISGEPTSVGAHSPMALAMRVGLTIVLTGVAWTHDALRQQALKEQAALMRELGAARLIAEDARQQAENERKAAQEAHAMSRMLLDNIDHAILLVEADGRMAPQHSAAAVDFFGRLRPGTPIWRIFAKGNARFGTWLEACWASAEDGWMPLSEVLGQLPKQITFRDRHFALELRVIDPSTSDSPVLVVVSDVTTVVQAREAEEASRGVAVLMSRSLQDAHVVASFINEGDRLVAGMAAGGWPVADEWRAIHTLKGSASLMGLGPFAAWLHGLEDRMDQGDGCDAKDRAALVERWAALVRPLDPFLNRTEDRDLLVRRTDLEALVDQVRGNASHSSILASIEMLEWEPVQPRLDHLAEQANELSQRFGHNLVETIVSCDEGLRVPPGAEWTSLWSNVGHVIRNAIDHGLESAEEREAAGKSRQGRLSLRAGRSGGWFILEVADDGRGICWESVARRAEAMGLPHATRADLERAPFADGLSTAGEATELSGRGVGLSALLHAAERLGGRVELDSEKGKGTTFRTVLPMVALLTEAREAARSTETAALQRTDLRLVADGRTATHGASR